MDQLHFEKLLADTLAAHGRSPRTAGDVHVDAAALRPVPRQAHLPKTLDALTPEDVEAYQRYLVTERKVGFSSFNQSTCALRFFYRSCLGKTDWTIARMPYQRKRRILPEILSPEEVAAIFDACHNLKHKALLMTSYSGGLRLGETLGLRRRATSTAQRMMIRVEQGKGRKDRYVMLSPTLLDDAAHLLEGLPPRPLALRGQGPRDSRSRPSTAEKVFTAAAGRAGITQGRLVPLAAPRLRDAPARGRHQHPRHPGPARTPVPDHHPGLHPRGAHLRERHQEPARPAEREEAGAGQGVGRGLPGCPSPEKPRRYEVADILRDHAHGLRLTGPQSPGRARHRRLPHRAARRPSRGLPELRLLPRLLQLLPEPALSQVPDPEAGPVGRGAGGPAPAHSSTSRSSSRSRASCTRSSAARPRCCLTLLFEAVSETLTEVARTKLKATIGFTAVLHTWNQQLGLPSAPPLLVPAGGLSLDGVTLDPARPGDFFLPVKPLRRLFRGKLLSKLERALRDGRDPRRPREGPGPAPAHAARRGTSTSSAPLAGPGHVVRYLSRYVHRIAIANSRITRTTDRTSPSATRTAPTATSRTAPSAGDFARAFLQHVLPPRFVRIRHFGLLAARRRKDLARCRELLGAQPVPTPQKEAWADAFRRLLGTDPLLCPKCGKADMVIVQILEPLSP